MKSVLMMTNLPMDKELTRKAMAAVYGGNGGGSAAPSVSTTSTANTPFTTSFTGTLPGYAISNPVNVWHDRDHRLSARVTKAVEDMNGFLDLMAGGD